MPFYLELIRDARSFNQNELEASDSFAGYSMHVAPCDFLDKFVSHCSPTRLFRRITMDVKTMNLKRKLVSSNDKLNAIKHLERDELLKNVAKDYGVGVSTVADLQKIGKHRKVL